jgi:ArsR family transcriptional regulator
VRAADLFVFSTSSIIHRQASMVLLKYRLLSIARSLMTTTAPHALVPVQTTGCCSGDICTCVDCTCSSFLATALDESTAAVLASGFAALADPVRLRLVNLLATAPEGAACVCDLIAPLGKSQSTVSHHLKVLGDAGLVTGSKHGRRVSYRLLDERLGALRTALTKEHVHD